MTAPDAYKHSIPNAHAAYQAAARRGYQVYQAEDGRGYKFSTIRPATPYQRAKAKREAERIIAQAVSA